MLKLEGSDKVWKILSGADPAKQDNVIIALSRMGSETSIYMLQKIALSDKCFMALRKSADYTIGNSRV
jgi:hypothetical protein